MPIIVVDLAQGFCAPNKLFIYQTLGPKLTNFVLHLNELPNPFSMSVSNIGFFGYQSFFNIPVEMGFETNWLDFRLSFCCTFIIF